MNQFVLVQSFPFNLDIQTINQIKDFISREVYLLHQIVCSRKVLRWNLMIRKLKKSWNTRRLLTLPQIFLLVHYIKYIIQHWKPSFICQSWHQNNNGFLTTIEHVLLVTHSKWNVLFLVTKIFSSMARKLNLCTNVAILVFKMTMGFW